MKIKSSENTQHQSLGIYNFWKSLFTSKFKFLIYLMILASVSLISLKKGRDLQKTHQYGALQTRLSHLITSKFNTVGNWVKAQSESPDNLNISIDHIEFQKLAHVVKRAREKGIIDRDMKSVNAECYLEYNGEKKIKAMVSVKGQELKHLQPEKWSLKFKLKGNNTIKGLKKFSIQGPPTRNYIYDPLLHKFLNYYGTPSLKYDFINVTLNGKDLGVFNMEENYHKILLERNKYREGLIFKVRSDTVKVYNVNQVIKNQSVVNKHIGVVTMQFRKFFNEEISTSELFDTKKLSKYMAISDIFGGLHGHLANNFPMYFNPVTHLWEPIPMDANAGTELKGKIAGSFVGRWTAARRKLGNRIFSDTSFYKLYVSELKNLNKVWVDTMLKKFEPEYNRWLNVIYQSYPEFNVNFSFFDKNLADINHLLSPQGKLINCVYTYNPEGNQIVVNYETSSSLPLKFYGLYFKNQPISSDPLEHSIIYPKDQIVNSNGKFTFNLLEGIDLKKIPEFEIKIKYSVLGNDEMGFGKMVPLEGNKIALPHEYLKPNLNQKSWKGIKSDESKKLIEFHPGEISISQTLILPRNYHVSFLPGAKVDLTQGAKVISYSALHIEGTPAHPVIIFSSDTTGQGVTVLNAAKESKIKHLKFIHQRNPKISSWELSGAINFYESKVSISNSEFSHNYCEDMINIIRSEFTMDNSIVTNTKSDAFDGDFVVGKISTTNFTNSGNDALDFSGSQVELNSLNLYQTGDKAISAGEKSTITAKKIDIVKAEIGLASKDGSSIAAESINMDSISLAVTAFQKKPEYSSASIQIEKSKLSNIGEKLLLEKGSSASINGVQYAYNQKKVKELLYGVQYGIETKR